MYKLQIYQIAESNKKNQFSSENRIETFLPELECSSTYMKKIQQCHQTISNKEERKVATRNCHRSITNPHSWRCLVSLHDLAAAHSPLHHSDAHLLTSQQISDKNWHNEDHTTVTIWTRITSSVWWKCPKTVKCRVWMTLQKHHYLKDTDLLTQAWSMGVLEGHHNFYTHECMTCLQCFDAVGWATGRASGLWKTEWWVLAWLSVWSEVQTCIWPSWCHCHSLSLASVKSRLVLPFWY